MKKFYCLYNRNNLPFSWKLKQANEKPIAHFKSREDCLNYYLSFNNVGIIWFQKASSKATKKENLKDSFDGYIKSEMKNNVLIHTIGVMPKTTENATRILKRNLFHALQIDPETGKDLLDEKGIDRLYTNKNSYLIFDKDIAEEISTVYDAAEPVKVTDKELYGSNDESNPSLSAPEILREKIKQSPSSPEREKVKEEDIVLGLDIEYTEPVQNEEMNTNNNYYSGDENIYYSTPEQNQFNNYDPYFQNNNYGNYIENNNMWNRHNFGVNINDFNFQNDFGNYRFKIFPRNQQNSLNKNFGNYSDNNGKILKNNFYKYYRGGGTYMNSNNNKYNTTNINTGNDAWVPVGPVQNIQRPYGTVEFTAVPNQMLNTDVNPLGVNTMIFNPYTMQNQFANSLPTYNNSYNNSPETIIQPIIQPIIQTVYKQPKTTVLEPIINEPIISNANYPSYNNDYSQYYQNTGTIAPASMQKPYYETSEFKFNNNANADANNYSQQNTATQNTAVATMDRPVNGRTKTTVVKNQQDQETVSETKKRKPKSKKKTLYALMISSLLLVAGIVVVIALIFTKIIVL